LKTKGNKNGTRLTNKKLRVGEKMGSISAREVGGKKSISSTTTY